MKALIFDSGPLINFSMNGLLNVLEKLKEKSGCSFFITTNVKKEVYDRPVNIPKFELGALKINSLIRKNILEMPESAGIPSSLIESKTKRLTAEANRFISVEGLPVNIVSEAEMSCFILDNELRKKNYKTLIAIDERTARMLSEKPENLARLMSERLHKKASILKSTQTFKGYSFIRSSELVYAAYKLGLIDIKDPRTLEALILATKFKGSSISWEEINILKKL